MRSRLVLAIAAVASVAVLLLALPLAVVLQRNYRDDELLRLQRDTVAATRQVDIAPAQPDPIELPQSSDALGAYDAQGRLVAGDGPSQADAIIREAIGSGRLADTSGEGEFTVAVPLLHRERVAGALRAVRSDEAAVDRTERAWLALGGFAIGIVALAVLAAVILGRRLASPLERLAAIATRLGDGDFSVRAPRSDLPEADAVGEALTATATRLGELLARERAFSADASHQLRTPLAALRIELEAIELRRDPPQEVKRALREIDRLESTIKTLISVARDSERAPAEADLGLLLNEAEQRWVSVLAAAGRSLHVTAPDHLLARASPAVMAEVLEVLLDNAYRHGDGAVTLTAREAPNEWVAVDVADEGPGLSGDPEAVFARRGGSAPNRGHGIGLHLARSLAMAEGGRIVVSRTEPNPIFSLLLQRAE